MMPLGDDNSLRKSKPIMTYVLILLNIIIFFVEFAGGEEFINNWSFIPKRFLADPLNDVSTLFTAMFMHSGLTHLAGNMLYLWIFGDNVEDRFGKIPFLMFYLLSGIAATFAQLYFTPNSNLPNLGASGAIAGVLGAYLILFPKGKVNVLVGRAITQMSALIVIGFWFLLQFVSGVMTTTTGDADVGGVAYMAHVGGFVAGFLMGGVYKFLSPEEREK